MGFCYEGRRLCCDLCGTAGARKVRCPFGYCQAIAACPACRKDPEKKAKWLSKAAHEANGCKQRHEAFVAAEQERAVNIAAGRPVLKAARGLFDGSGLVHVLFETRDGFIGRLIPEAIYDARDGHDTPLAWFEQLNGGPFAEASNDFAREVRA